MKCKCGNEQGKPRVSPWPFSFKEGKEVIHLYFNGGMVQVKGETKCWFCYHGFEWLSNA